MEGGEGEAWGIPERGQDIEALRRGRAAGTCCRLVASGEGMPEGTRPEGKETGLRCTGTAGDRPTLNPASASPQLGTGAPCRVLLSLVPATGPEHMPADSPAPRISGGSC